KNFCYPHTAQRHQEHIMESILNFGLQTKVIGCVSDNEEATVQGIRTMKAQLERDYKNSSFNALRCAVHSLQLSLKSVFRACCDQLTLARDLVILAKNSPKFAQRIAEISETIVEDVEDNGVDSFHGHVTLKLDTETRWNSTYAMFISLLRMRKPLEELFSEFSTDRSIPKAWKRCIIS
ncbi:hypothetical protein V1525DRAFT_394682, partial [Lipomyces kononenkoae]